MKALLVILIAAVCFSVVIGDNSKLILELLKKSPLSGATLPTHTNLATRSVQPRQAVYGTCTLEEFNDIASTIPPECYEDIDAIDLSELFLNFMIRNPAIVTEFYRIVCQPRCANPIVQFYLRCSLNQAADEARYMCSTNAAGSQCFELFDLLFANANQAASSCSGSTSFSCTPSCSNALTTLRDNSGCCVNFLNDSAVLVPQSSVLSTLEFELWDECNVITPDFCNLETSNISSTVQPRQDVFGTCILEEFTSAIPQDCDEDIAAITGGDLSALLNFDNLLNWDPATLTEVYRVFCQPRCGNPIVQAYLRCGLNQAAEAARYLCSTNAAGSQCFELFDPLLADARQAISRCLRSTSFSCTSLCSNALTTLRDSSGCCVNFLNDSVVLVTQSSVLSTLEFELWEECNVNTPDFCNLETSSISSAVAVLLSKILFVGLLLAAFVFML